ncbi:hypothetical protein KAU51_05135 [Candidatus Parcubacteria bacterium]|nr:hypothetical protein [Candidatus Parcubacteria bacterium]
MEKEGIKMSKFVPEYSEMFKSKSIKHFELLKVTKKITFDFYVNIKERDKFLQWVNTLSSVEFKVDVDLDGIQIKNCITTNNNKEFNRVLKDDIDYRVLVRVKASGKKEDLDRWYDNLYCVEKFLKGNYDITYFKTIGEQED